MGWGHGQDKVGWGHGQDKVAWGHGQVDSKRVHCTRREGKVGVGVGVMLMRVRFGGVGWICWGDELVRVRLVGIGLPVVDRVGGDGVVVEGGDGLAGWTHATLLPTQPHLRRRHRTRWHTLGSSR